VNYLWKIMIRPRAVAALMSQGADLCHGCTVLDSTATRSFFGSLGMFKFWSPSREVEGPVWAGAIGSDVT
jgi:hypothetical protein